MAIWVLGDQLTTAVGPLADAEPSETRVLLVESRDFARRLPYHGQKLVLVFAAMGHFRDRLRDLGYDVEYVEAETFDEGLATYFDAYPGDDLTVMEPASHGAASRLETLVERHGGTLEVVENETFYCSPAAFDEWAADRDSFRHETFYRWMRRRTGYLMTEPAAEDGGDADDPPQPVGGDWNYDEQNRETPSDVYSFPDPPAFDPDALTRSVVDWVESTFDYWGSLDGFAWPVTREEALAARDAFVAERLPEFGPFQDAMLADEWALNHAVLSPAINLGLLHPREVIEPAIEAYERGDAPLGSVEGLVRQLLGWREFMRQVYRRSMPDLADANALDATRDLPDCYYTGETDMRCLGTVVDRVRERGYSHHIERLMILSNFALLYGADPAELNRWFHLAYVDAYHWVTTPNVIGMGVFATDVCSTKPYAASANYVDRMSDFCGDCRYDPDETTGADACPFNALYWEFLDRNEERLRSNYRMGLVYSHLDRKSDAERDAIRDRASEIRSAARDETL